MASTVRTSDASWIARGLVLLVTLLMLEAINSDAVGMVEWKCFGIACAMMLVFHVWRHPPARHQHQHPLLPTAHTPSTVAATAPKFVGFRTSLRGAVVNAPVRSTMIGNVMSHPVDPRVRSMAETDTDATAAENTPAVPPEPRFNPEKVNFVQRQYFYSRVSMELGPGYKAMETKCTSSWKDEESSLCCVEVPMPMGMIIEASDTLIGKIQVCEVLPDSNAAKAGILPGDVIRFVTAQKADAAGAAETNIAFNAFAGATMAGVSVKRALFNCDGMEFGACMNAISTNSKENPKAPGPGSVAMCLERRNPGK